MAQKIADAVKRTASRIADAYKKGNEETESIGQGLHEVQANVNAVAPEKSTPKPAAPAAAKTPSAVDKVGRKYTDTPGAKEIDTHEMVKPLGSFKKGGTVPKTGAYILHKDEKVTPAKKEDSMATPFDMITGGKKTPKTIHHHEYSKTHNGKHVVTHKHHSPEHKDEMHAFEDFQGAADHMNENPPQPEPEAAPAGPAAGPMPAGM